MCYLKEDQSEFLDERRMTDVAKKHCEFIGFPVPVEGLRLMRSMADLPS